ncbi:MAG: hypothetical protein ACRD2Y_14910 [Terriglobales bacterium]
MSEWTNREGARLKAALAAKRAKIEREKHEKEIKQTQGLGLWEDTIKAAIDFVAKINETAGSNALLWRSENNRDINVIVPEFGQKYNILARFNNSDCKVTWSVPPGAIDRKLTGIVVEDRLM